MKSWSPKKRSIYSNDFVYSSAMVKLVKMDFNHSHGGQTIRSADTEDHASRNPKVNLLNFFIFRKNKTKLLEIRWIILFSIL